MIEPPYRLEPDATAAGLAERYAELEAGGETGATVTVAGRMMLRREMGKLAFATLRDSSGSIQLFAGAKWTADFDGFVKLSLGDWIAATGEVVRTRTGELSVKVSEWVQLAEARRSFGDKFRGISDVDTRYRQRYADLWANEDSRRVLLLRSRIISWTRRWLEDQGFVEVETPIFHPMPGGAAARPFVTHHNSLDVDLYLRIAPELYLKRLVVGGIEQVFEINRNFRNEGISTRHNPEFTMLEWYEAYADHVRAMDLTETLIRAAAQAALGTTAISYQGLEIDLGKPFHRLTVTESVRAHNPDLADADLRDPAVLAAKLAQLHLPCQPAWGWGKRLIEIFEKTVEGHLQQPTFITEYPLEVSPLARRNDLDPEVTDRFELMIAGRELANGFSELNDPEDQAARFRAQVEAKDAGDEEAMFFDADYIRALEYGMPPTAGVGLGIDRLVMLLADQPSIREVILFPHLRPEQT